MGGVISVLRIFSKSSSFRVIEMKLNFQDLLVGLSEEFASDHVNIEAVEAMMANYESDPRDWRQFAKFDRYRYTRNLVADGGGRYNLMLLCWNESQGSSVHDHADAHCFMKVLSGSLREVRFAWPKESAGLEEGNLEQTGVTSLKTNEVCYMNDSLGLHRVENESHSNVAVSLHLYCPPFAQCSTFDEKTGKRNIAKVTFWSKFGERTPYQLMETSVRKTMKAAHVISAMKNEVASGEHDHHNQPSQHSIEG